MDSSFPHLGQGILSSTRYLSETLALSWFPALKKHFCVPYDFISLFLPLRLGLPGKIQGTQQKLNFRQTTNRFLVQVCPMHYSEHISTLKKPICWSSEIQVSLGVLYWLLVCLALCFSKSDNPTWLSSSNAVLFFLLKFSSMGFLPNFIPLFKDRVFFPLYLLPLFGGGRVLIFSDFGLWWAVPGFCIKGLRTTHQVKFE